MYLDILSTGVLLVAFILPTILHTVNCISMDKMYFAVSVGIAVYCFIRLCANIERMQFLAFIDALLFVIFVYIARQEYKNL